MIVASVFPSPTGNDRGRLNLTFLFVFPLTAFAGVTIGYGIPLYLKWNLSRIATIAIQLALIAAGITIVLFYGRFLAPEYFEFAVAQSWAGVTFIIGVIMILLGNVEAKGEKKNKLFFIETGINCTNIPHHARADNDGFAPYLVNPSEKSITLGHGLTKGQRNRMKNKPEVGKSLNKVAALPGKVSDSRTQSRLPILSEQRGFLAGVGITESSVHLPEVHARRLVDDRAEVKVAGNSVTVNPGKRSVVDLGTETVQFRERPDEFSEREDPRRPGKTIKVRKMGDLQSIDIGMELVIRNRGRLDVYDSS